jgi:hypothetical protein
VCGLLGDEMLCQVEIKSGGRKNRTKEFPCERAMPQGQSESLESCNTPKATFPGWTALRISSPYAEISQSSLRQG